MRRDLAPRAVGADRPACGDGCPVSVEPGGHRLRQYLLRRGRAGRLAELVGVVLRVPGRPQLHHRRQAARLAVGDRVIGASVRHEQLGGAGSPGADGGGRGRGAVRHGAQGVRRRGPGRGGGPACRRCARMHPRGGSDVSLQQSRRAARAPVDHGRLLRDARGQRGVVAVAGTGRCGDGLCVSDQDVPGLPRAARICVGLLDFCADNAGRGGCSISSAPWRRWWSRVDGGCWRCSWCPRTRGPTSAGPPTTPCSIWRSGTTGSAESWAAIRSPAISAIGRTSRRSAPAPGCTGSSRARWPTRSPGCSWLRCSHWRSAPIWPCGGHSTVARCAR